MINKSKKFPQVVWRVAVNAVRGRIALLLVVAIRGRGVGGGLFREARFCRKSRSSPAGETCWREPASGLSPLSLAPGRSAAVNLAGSAGCGCPYRSIHPMIILKRTVIDLPTLGLAPRG